MKIGIVGDLILSDRLKIDQALLDILHGTDLNIANLEAPFVRKGMKPELKAGLHQLVKDCKTLKQLNIAAVSLANNHICDFGPSGLEMTRQVLNDHGIFHFGAGSNLEKALQPAEINLLNSRIHCWGFMQKYASGRHFATMRKSGVAELRRNLILPELLGSDAPVKIVYMHWNQEFESYPEPVNKLLAEELSQHCNLIVGSHSHCLQGIQSANQSLIFHGMGNFSMPALPYAGTTLMEYPPLSRQAMIMIAQLDGTTPDYTIHPIQVDHSGCLISDPAKGEANKIRSHLHSISEPLQEDYKVYRKFYNANKQRRLLPTQVRNRQLNRIRLWLYYGMDRCIRYTERILASLLARMGLLNYVKRRFTRLLDYIQSNR